MTVKHSSNIPATLTTAEAAQALNRKIKTLHKWAFTRTGAVQPLRINGRLAWPADQIAALLSPTNDADSGATE